MIKIVLTDHPNRGKPEVQKAIGERLDLSGGYMPSIRTEITHNGASVVSRTDDECWDIDVYAQEGNWSVRVPLLSRSVNTADMLFELMLYQNGEATDWIRQLLGQPDVDGIWERYRREVPA